VKTLDQEKDDHQDPSGRRERRGENSSRLKMVQKASQRAASVSSRTLARASLDRGELAKAKANVAMARATVSAAPSTSSTSARQETVYRPFRRGRSPLRTAEMAERAFRRSPSACSGARALSCRQGWDSTRRRRDWCFGDVALYAERLSRDSADPTGAERLCQVAPSEMTMIDLYGTTMGGSISKGPCPADAISLGAAQKNRLVTAHVTPASREHLSLIRHEWIERIPTPYGS